MLSILLAAMVTVESGGDCSAVGDGGKSRGPLQISRAYYDDALEQLKDEDPAYDVPSYEVAAHSPRWSGVLARAYFRRYAPESCGAFTVADCEVLARIHNGGPRGHKKKATLAYWQRVKKELDKAAKKG